MGWISVDERLPEDGKFVMIYNPRGMMMRSIGNLQRETFTWWDVISGVWTKSVTHWQPLPAPPKSL